MGVIKDLTGQTFGYLTVTSFAYSKNQRAYWNCVCTCGNTIIAMGNQLKTEKMRSCGCLRRKDYTGLKYNSLTFVSFDHMDKGTSYWKVKCDCGKVLVANSNSIICGGRKSCGCIKRVSPKRNSAYSRFTHCRLRNIYRGMKTRCYNIKSKDYAAYGGRGIKICDDWYNTPLHFFLWAESNGYTDNLSIDRIDVNKGYSPENCRWITLKEQNSNKRSNHFITYKGDTKTISQWAAELKIPKSVFIRRFNNGMSIDEILNTPIVRSLHEVTFNGKTKNLAEWSEETGISYSAIVQRLRNGWTIERTLTTPTLTNETRNKYKNA